MWKKSYPYLNDNNFLLKIDTQHLQNQFIKLILLDWNENPITEIQGLATGGSLSLNGNSAIRRTCSLSLTVTDTEDINITNVKNLISIGKKVFLEIGIKNNTNEYEDYPIIWYPQGLFVFTQCSVASTVSQSTTISAQLKDKMCLLNGECGGIITSSIQFDTIDTVNEQGEWTTIKPTLTQIIREAVNHLGGEQLGNILISDIDERVKVVMRWSGSSPVYLVQEGGNDILTTNKTLWDGTLNTKFEYGDDIGFIYDNFTYLGELIAKPGDNICTAVLDKVKSFLGNYEYYYDIYGNFIFQEIKNYLNTTQAKVELNNLTKDDYIVDMSKGKSVYTFENSPIITSYSNNPQYNKIKNDFVIWGERTSTSNLKHNIRYHLAIDKKPQIGNIYDVYMYTDEDDKLIKAAVPLSYPSKSSFPEVGIVGMFYLDISNNKVYQWNVDSLDYIISTIGEMKKIKTNDWRSELYLQGAAAEPLGLKQNLYYAELKAEWPKLYNLAATQVSGQDYYIGAFYQNVLDYPWDVDYWLDFIDSQEAIGQLGINLIGKRSLSEDKNEYNCVFEPEVPDYVLIEINQPDTTEKTNECIIRNQRFIQIDPNIYMNLVIGGTKNSCFERIKNVLYEYTNYNNTITLNSLPIYHLEPNTRITVISKENDISGDYMITSMSIPLTISGTMSISAIKCSEKL